MTDEMEQLSKERATELIEFIYSTNYKIGDCITDATFTTKEDALSFVNNVDYEPESALEIRYKTQNPESWESAVVFNDELEWFIHNYNTSKKSGLGDSIKEAIVDYIGQHDSNSPHRPVKLESK